MMRKVLCVVSLVVIGAMAWGCGASITAWRNPNLTEFPIPQDEQHRAIVFPIDIHVAGDADALSLALVAGIISAGGSMVIPGQPLRPLLEAAGISNLSWQLGEAMYHSAFVHDAPAVWDHDFAVIVDAIAQLTGLVGQMLESVGVEGATPAYLLVAHIDALGSGTIPGSENWRYFGGLLSLDDAPQILTAFYAEKTVVTAGAEAEMVGIGRSLAQMPFCLDMCDAEAEALRSDPTVAGVHFRSFL